MGERSEIVGDLLAMLKHQYPGYACAPRQCISCGGPAIGDTRCKHCLSTILVECGVRRSLVDAINAALTQRQRLSAEIADLCVRAQEQAQG